MWFDYPPLEFSVPVADFLHPGGHARMGRVETSPSAYVMVGLDVMLDDREVLKEVVGRGVWWPGSRGGRRERLDKPAS